MLCNVVISTPALPFDSTSTRRRRIAFTLIELVVSLAILALLSLLVFGRSTQQIQDLRVSQFVERLSTLDQTSRIAAQQKRSPITLNVAPRKRTLARRDASGRTKTSTMNVPATILELRVRSGSSWSASPTDVEIASSGRSVNYALRLRLSHDRIRYFAVVGATGQVIVTQDQRLIDGLFDES